MPAMTRLKLGAHNLFLNSFVGGRNPSMWPVTCFLLGCALTGRWNQRWSSDLNLGILIMAYSVLTHANYCTKHIPQRLFRKKFQAQ